MLPFVHILPIMSFSCFDSRQSAPRSTASAELDRWRIITDNPSICVVSLSLLSFPKQTMPVRLFCSISGSWMGRGNVKDPMLRQTEHVKVGEQCSASRPETCSVLRAACAYSRHRFFFFFFSLSSWVVCTQTCTPDPSANPLFLGLPTSSAPRCFSVPRPGFRLPSAPSQSLPMSPYVPPIWTARSVACMCQYLVWSRLAFFY